MLLHLFRIIHIDTDPLKKDIPIWGFSVDLAITADSELACRALAQEIANQSLPEDRERFSVRKSAIQEEHRSRLEKVQQISHDRTQLRPIAPEWAATCLNEIIDANTLIIGEAVSDAPNLWKYLNLNTPGSYFQSLGSGLGWGLGAAFGAKLADPSKTVVSIVGDGAWLFASPLAAYWASLQKEAPFLTVVFNNQEYFSTTEAILTMAPEGSAKKTNHYPACGLPKPPLFAAIAEAIGLWAKTVEEPSQLTDVLKEAASIVKQGQPALVDVIISSPRPEGS